jgi:hypothetical protein
MVHSARGLRTALMGLVLVGGGASLNLPASAAEISVYKTPTCGCCTEWVEHLEQNGFEVTVRSLDDLGPIKSRLGVPYDLQSCHTAEVGGYVVEGHVPAEDIRRLLEERPTATGIAVPGMPVGSPGMEYGYRRDPYEVILFRAGAQRIFSAH